MKYLEWIMNFDPARHPEKRPGLDDSLVQFGEFCRPELSRLRHEMGPQPVGMLFQSVRQRRKNHSRALKRRIKHFRLHQSLVCEDNPSRWIREFACSRQISRLTGKDRRSDVTIQPEVLSRGKKPQFI